MPVQFPFLGVLPQSCDIEKLDRLLIKTIQLQEEANFAKWLMADYPPGAADHKPPGFKEAATCQTLATSIYPARQTADPFLAARSYIPG